MAVVRNKPTELGKIAGARIAALCDEAEPKARLHFPELPPRCGTCAFRAGTFPNGCESTIMDAFKCALEGTTEFHCHETPRKGEVCSGWAMLMLAKNSPDDLVKAPWPFSDELPAGA